ncbi:MAG: septum formation initiator family protein [Candidatus Cloacimonetes bacterium]|nr:septum formation initiator family protein [Candidatus Cloacimonadota bacterium]
MANWTEQEEEKMKWFVKSNPKLNPGLQNMNSKLKDMFPDRTEVSIYSKWYCTAKEMYGEDAPITNAIWSKDDTWLMREWINDNPGVVPGWKNGNVNLNKLFPDKSAWQIYYKWRRERGKVANREGKKVEKLGSWGVEGRPEPQAIVTLDNSNTNWDGIMGYLSACMEEYVKTKIRMGIEEGNIGPRKSIEGKLHELEEKVDKLTDENEKLKELLRKLTKVREAVQEFQGTL